MLRSLNRFTMRYFLVISLIFIYIVIDSFLGVSALHAGIIAYLPRDSLIDFRILAFNIVLLAISSPLLLSLLLLCRPSFLRVLLHAASALYTLVTLPLILKYTSPLMLVVSSAALVAGHRRRWRPAGGRDGSTMPGSCFGFTSLIWPTLPSPCFDFPTCFL